MWFFRRYTWLAIALISALNIVAWSAANAPNRATDYDGSVGSFSFAPFRSGQNPEELKFPTIDEVREDLATVSTVAKRIRTYSLEEAFQNFPALAKDAGLDLTLGIWLARDRDRSETEMAAFTKLAQSTPYFSRVIAGNEVLLREDMSAHDLITYIKRVKGLVNVPVSTAEPWHIWLKHPELADAVDFITVHLLPYWEGLPVDAAVDYVFFRLNELREMYPDKHIVIGETGWPSDGSWERAAEPSRTNQARFLREFLPRAHADGLDYYIMEAFDQDWKKQIEGSVGAYWGFFDENRQPKVDLTGFIQERTHWEIACLLATLLGLLPMVYFARRQRKLSFAGLLFFGAVIQLAASVLTWTLWDAWNAGANVQLGWVWGASLLAQVILLALLLADGFEFTEMVFSKKFDRLFGPAPDDGRTNWPKVSIHLPCYNEPPAMVIETLDALAALDYPNFEVLVIDNNTKDPEVWLPLQAHCDTLNTAHGSERFRFIHLDNWPGYKAGALNYGLKVTAPDAEIVAVIDSDYIVTPNWLRATVPYFDNPKMAIVQGPQDYRGWDSNTFQAMCHWEYAGFFYIGMIQRNERNAIIQHGTMTQVRKTCLQQASGWAEWCITEDAELGLRLFAEGYEAAYLPHSFGRGLIPDGFSAYKTQRFRWAYGAMQILKRHWRALLPHRTEGQLNTAQQFHFIAGWLPWLADAAMLCFAVGAIVWSALLCFSMVEFPPTVFLIPTLIAFMFKIVAGFVLYGVRVRASWGQRIGAAIAGLSLSHTVGRAVLQGLFTSGKPFVRTPKLADRPAIMQGVLMATEEIIILLGLLVSATTVLIVFTAANREALLWSTMLYIQTIPYWAACATALINAVPRWQNIKFLIGPNSSAV
jgi:exo-beta-1,3-glucanase (GH17 family)/cellulose synthase/poly-beta-1,6-N-acetylglucosamine synthase-like glycosyltransferase